jgi:hypothetical protein
MVHAEKMFNSLSYLTFCYFSSPPIVVISLCQGVSAILGCMCIFAVAGLYFMLTIGKKASIDEMRSRAAPGSESKHDLTNEQLP